MSHIAAVSLDPCPATHAAECAPAHCRARCALEVIDDLLSRPGALTGGEADLLLDLRWKLSRREDAEGVLRLFCDVRMRMEHRHYLAFFRIRRWLENQLVASVRICPVAEEHFVPVHLKHFCVEAIRRTCICSALHTGLTLLAPRLRFVFRQTAPVATAPRALMAEARS